MPCYQGICLAALASGGMLPYLATDINISFRTIIRLLKASLNSFWNSLESCSLQVLSKLLDKFTLRHPFLDGYTTFSELPLKPPSY